MGQNSSTLGGYTKFTDVSGGGGDGRIPASLQAVGSGVPARRSNFVPARVVGWAKSAGNGFTVHGCFPSPRPFTHVQLMYEGLSAATGITAKVAPSAIRGNGYSPKTSAGADVTPSDATFGTTDPNDFTNPGGGSATGSISAGSGLEVNADIVNGRLFSDILPVASLDRSDGGSNWLLMVRSYSAGALPAASQATMNPATTDASGSIQTIEPDWAGGVQSGDFVTTNFGTYAPAETWISPAAVRFLIDRELVFVATYADSTGAGWSGATDAVQGGGVQGYARRAVRSLQSKGQPVIHYNRAKEGSKTASFLGNALREIPNTRPSIAFLRSWSINDGISQAILDAAFNLLLQVLATCRRYNTVPVVEVPPPQGLSAANDLLRVAYCQRVRNIGCPTLDLDAILTNGAVPAAIRPDLKAADGSVVHPNGVGHNVIAVTAEQLIVQLAGLQN